MTSNTDQGLDVALQTRAAISDLYMRHIILIAKRLRILTPLKAPNPRSVILVLGEEYSGKSSLISYITGAKLRSEGMCLNVYIPCTNDATYLVDTLADTLPAIHACLCEHGFPRSHIRCVPFNSYNKQTLRTTISTTHSQLQSGFYEANLSPTGKSMYYSTRSSTEGIKQISRRHDSPPSSNLGYIDGPSNSASIYNSIDRLEESLHDTSNQPIGPSCPFIFIEVPFFYRYVMELSSSKGLLSSLSNFSKKDKQAAPNSLFSKTEIKVFENTIKALFAQSDRILFTTSCDMDTKNEGFSVENGKFLHHISSSNDLFRKTTILITKCDRLTDKQSCIDAIQECASSLVLISPYRRFKINLVCIPYYSNIKAVNEQAKIARLKSDIYNTMKTLDEQTRALVDTSTIALEATRLSATLNNKPYQHNINEIETGTLKHFYQDQGQMGISNLTLSADKQDKFLASSLPPSQQPNYSLIDSLQQSNMEKTLVTSQAVVNAIAGKLITQCCAMLKIVNPNTYDLHPSINQGSSNLDTNVVNILRGSNSSMRQIGELLSSTDELCWYLKQSIFTDNENIIKVCHSDIINILKRLEYNVRAVRRIKRKNALLTLLRIFLVILAVLLCFMIASSMQLFGTDFLHTRCHVHHLERHQVFEGGRFDGSSFELTICILLYEIGVLGLRQLSKNTLSLVCIWALVPLLILMTVFLDALYSVKPLQNDELAALKHESEYVLRPTLIMLDEFLEQKDNDVE